MSKIKQTYELPFKRRYKGKTDYRARLALVKSGLPRVVLRFTSNRAIAELIKYEAKGDKVLAYATTNDIVKLGWKHSKKNTPACYLLGYMIGKLSAKIKVKEAVLDLGLHKSSSRVGAFIKGMTDAGLQVPHSEDIIPDEKRIKGEHIINAAKSIKNKNQFSKVKPDNMAKDFEEIKKKISGV
ncbi:MAG: 50S ribosomal protein L18 [Candidatus Aenigmatarchaeota archaeon]